MSGTHAPTPARERDGLRRVDWHRVDPRDVERIERTQGRIVVVHLKPPLPPERLRAIGARP